MSTEFAPDFFIAGVPKSGTTALYSYVSAHPQVFMPELKEPHFFSSDLPGLREVHTETGYRALFKDVGQRLCGEASASYLYSRAALPAVLARNPAAQIIVVLRNPVDAVQALHQELCYNLTENVAEFQWAWQLQQVRRDGAAIPRTCGEPSILQYRSVYHYAEQLHRLFECAPSPQVLVLLFDDLVQNPRGTYGRVLAFLKLVDDGRDSFERVNAAKALRSRTVSRVHRAAPAALGPLHRPLKSAVNRIGIHPSRIVERLNVAPRARPPLLASFRHELVSVFDQDIGAVEALVGQPLPSWRRVNQ